MIGGRRGHAARNESSRGERDKAQLMDLHGVSPWPFLGRSTRGGGGHCFQIGDDRVDLGALEVMLEGGHARRALADEAADDLIAASGRVLGQEGTVGSRVDLRRQMAK